MLVFFPIGWRPRKSGSSIRFGDNVRALLMDCRQWDFKCVWSSRPTRSSLWLHAQLRQTIFRHAHWTQCRIGHEWILCVRAILSPSPPDCMQFIFHGVPFFTVIYLLHLTQTTGILHSIAFTILDAISRVCIVHLEVHVRSKECVDVLSDAYSQIGEKRAFNLLLWIFTISSMFVRAVGENWYMSFLYSIAILIQFKTA